MGNASVSFELEIEMDDASPLIVMRSWSAGVVSVPRAKDLEKHHVHFSQWHTDLFRKL